MRDQAYIYAVIQPREPTYIGGVLTLALPFLVEPMESVRAGNNDKSYRFRWSVIGVSLGFIEEVEDPYANFNVS